MTPLLADQLAPPFDPRQLASIRFEVVPTVLIVACGGLYLWGVVQANRRWPRHHWSAWRTVAFVAGLALTLLALDSFIGVYERVLFWDHMVQHLMLVMMAAPLLAIGAPVALAFRATTGEAHQFVKRAMRSGPARFFDHPVVAFGIYAVVIPFTHLTSFYNLTLENGQVLDFEHLIFLLAGYAFWRQVVAYEPSQHRLHPGVRLAYVAFAIPVDTFVGLALLMSSHELFPAYTQMHRTWGPSLLQDLHLGGTVMWIGGDSLMLVAMVPAVLAWVRYEDRSAVWTDRRDDAPTGIFEVSMSSGRARMVQPTAVPVVGNDPSSGEEHGETADRPGGDHRDMVPTGPWVPDPPGPLSGS